MAVIAIPVEQVMPGDVLDVAGHGFTVFKVYDYPRYHRLWVAFDGKDAGSVPFNRGTILNVQRTTLESTLRETLIAELIKADWLDPEGDTDDIDSFVGALRGDTEDVDRFVGALRSAIAERFTVEPK